MSNDPVRVTFSDGTQLFTMGDSWSVRMDRLFDTKEEAINMYRSEYNGYIQITPEEITNAESDAEDVRVESIYGSLDGNFKEMIAPFCKASKSVRIITYGPSYKPEDWFELEFGGGYGTNR